VFTKPSHSQAACQPPANSGFLSKLQQWRVLDKGMASAAPAGLMQKVEQNCAEAGSA